MTGRSDFGSSTGSDLVIARTPSRQHAPQNSGLADPLAGRGAGRHCPPEPCAHLLTHGLPEVVTLEQFTESIRRSSPYHGPPGSSCNRHIGPEQARYWLALAATGHGKPSLAAFCPPKCPRMIFCRAVQWKGGSMTAHTFGFLALHTTHYDRQASSVPRRFGRPPMWPPQRRRPTARPGRSSCPWTAPRGQYGTADDHQCRSANRRWAYAPRAPRQSRSRTCGSRLRPRFDRSYQWVGVILRSRVVRCMDDSWSAASSSTSGSSRR
jgi:hypothetical protein